MNKISTLIDALNKINVNPKYIDQIYALDKIAAFTAPSNAEKTKELMYGRKEDSESKETPESDPETQESPAEPKPKETIEAPDQSSSKESTPAPAVKKEDGAPSSGRVGEDYLPVTINCSGKNLDVLKIFDFKNKMFFSSATCEQKLCLLEVLVNKSGQTKIISLFNLIMGCLKYYKANLNSTQFVDFLNKYIYKEGNDVSAIRDILESAKSGNEMLKDLVEEAGWLEAEDLTEVGYLFVPIDKNSFNKNKYLYIYLFYTFCEDGLEKIIKYFLSLNIPNFTPNNRDESFLHVFLKYYNEGLRESYDSCFTYAKLKLDFKNPDQSNSISNEKRKLMSFEDSDLTESISNKYKKDYEEDTGEDLKEVIKDYVKSSDKSVKNIMTKYQNFIKEDESGKEQIGNPAVCFYVNKAKAERDHEVLAALSSDIEYGFTKAERKYYISKEACLSGLFELAKANVIPIEYVELIYMQNGYKVSLESIKNRVEDSAQNNCIIAITNFFEKWKNDESGANPIEMYKDKAKTDMSSSYLNYQDNYDIPKEVALSLNSNNENYKSEYLISVYDKILGKHNEINALISKYKSEKTNADSRSIFDFYKNLFINKEKIILNKEYDGYTPGPIKDDITEMLKDAKALKLILNSLIGENAKKGNFAMQKEENQKTVKYYNEKNTKDHYYVTKEKEGSVAVDGKIKVGDKTYIKDKKYSNVSAYFLHNYIADLESLEKILSDEVCSSPACSFKTNSSLFQTICDQANNSTSLNKDDNLKAVLNTLFFDNHIGKVNLEEDAFSSKSKTGKALVQIAKGLSPSAVATEEINKKRKENHIKKVKEALASVTPLTYKTYIFSSDGKVFSPPLISRNSQIADKLSGPTESGSVTSSGGKLDLKKVCKVMTDINNSKSPEWYVDWSRVNVAREVSIGQLTNPQIVGESAKILKTYKESIIKFLESERAKLTAE